MARIAFFSDDEAGTLCAKLVCQGLRALPGSTTLALPEPARWAGPPGTTLVALPTNASAFEVELAASRASRRGDDFVASFALGALRDRSVRDQFDAVVTVGAREATASRALRAARYVASPGREAALDESPVWFMAGPGQAELQTKARLIATSGPRLPFATRVLPMTLPRMTPASHKAIEAGDTDLAVAGSGILMAALVLCVAADPTATRLTAVDVAAFIAARTFPAEQEVSDRLVVLADAYGRLDVDANPAHSEGYATSSRRRPASRHAGSNVRRPAPDERVVNATRRA